MRAPLTCRSSAGPPEAPFAVPRSNGSPGLAQLGGSRKRLAFRLLQVIPAVPPSNQGRLAGIEGLRALAATAVVIYHAAQVTSREGDVGAGPIATVMSPLAFGVPLFFILSGFLLYRPIAAAVAAGEKLPSARRFYRNRALRILPAYWVVLGITSFALGTAVLGFDGRNPITGPLTDLGTLLKHALLLQGYWPGTFGTGILPAWSLAIEVVFYLVLPALGLTAWLACRGSSSPSVRSRALWVPILALLALGGCGKLIAAYVVPGGMTAFNSSWHSVAQFSFLTYADVFAWGMAVAVLRVKLDGGSLRFPVRRLRLVVEGGALLVLLLWIMVLPAWSRGFLLPVPFALLLGAVALRPPTPDGRPSGLFLRLLASRPLVATGLVSYSLFLWHYPVLYWLQTQGVVRYGPLGFVTTLGILVVVSGVLAVITYRFVEVPALRLKVARARGARRQTQPFWRFGRDADEALSRRSA